MRRANYEFGADRPDNGKPEPTKGMTMGNSFKAGPLEGLADRFLPSRDSFGKWHMGLPKSNYSHMSVLVNDAHRHDEPSGHNPNLSDMQFGVGGPSDWGNGTEGGADLPDTGDGGLGYPAAY